MRKIPLLTLESEGRGDDPGIDGRIVKRVGEDCFLLADGFPFVAVVSLDGVEVLPLKLAREMAIQFDSASDPISSREPGFGLFLGDSSSSKW